MYLPGDSVLISDVGAFVLGQSDPGSSLVCVTSNVNEQCCRGSDGGNVGEWYFPNGTIVPRHAAGLAETDFTRSGFLQEVRLNRFHTATTPNGDYECRVPDDGNSSIVHVASITLAFSKFVDP